jgi:nucleotide-binding universal stress UspA family protein
MSTTNPRVVRPRVVVGVDGSPASIDALKWAIRYAQVTGGQVEAVTSWAVPDAGGAGLGAGFDAVGVDWLAVATESQETSLFQALSETLPGGGVSVKRTLIFDHPAHALLVAAEGADLLVVGSRGHGGFVGMLLGSVSAHVVAHAACPVLIIQHATGPVDAAEFVADGTDRNQAAGSTVSTGLVR